MTLYRLSLNHLRRLWTEYGILWSGAILVGLVAVLYAQAIEAGFGVFRAIEHKSPWLPLLLTPAVCALCVYLTRRFFPGSEGSGIPQAIATLHGDTAERGEVLLSIRVLLGKIVLSVVAIAGGMTIGREGPTGAVVFGEGFAGRHDAAARPRFRVLPVDRRALSGGIERVGQCRAGAAPILGIEIPGDR